MASHTFICRFGIDGGSPTGGGGGVVCSYSVPTSSISIVKGPRERRDCHHFSCARISLSGYLTGKSGGCPGFLSSRASHLRSARWYAIFLQLLQRLLCCKGIPGFRLFADSCNKRIGIRRGAECPPCRNRAALCPARHVEYSGFVLSTHMRACTRPGIFPRLRNKLRAYGITFDIPHGRPEIRIVDRAGVKPHLPEMTRCAIPVMKIACIRLIGTPHHGRKGIRRVRNHHDVQVIRHQTIGENTGRCLTGISV